MWFKSGLLLVVLFLTHCTHTHLNKKITRLPYQTAKFDVMDQLGSPYKIERKYGLDYWVYKFKVGNKEYIRKVILKAGYVIRKGKPIRYPTPKLVLDGVENLDEYEEAVEQFQKQRKDWSRSPKIPEEAR